MGAEEYRHFIIIQKPYFIPTDTGERVTQGFGSRMVTRRYRSTAREVERAEIVSSAMFPQN